MHSFNLVQWFIVMLYLIYHDANHEGNPFDFSEGRRVLGMALEIAPFLKTATNESWFTECHGDLSYKVLGQTEAVGTYGNKLMACIRCLVRTSASENGRFRHSANFRHG